MSKFSQASLDKLNTCHPQIIRLMQIVVLTFDITVVCGWRGEEEQTKALKEGKTHLGWPHSKHNKTLPDGTPCSEAVDVAPYSPIEPHIDWDDREKFTLMGGYILGVAEIVGIPVIWGGDWNKDFNMRGQRLVDLPHFELVI